LRSDADGQPAGAFDLADVPSELAVSTGVGLRILLGFLVVRLDFAVPTVRPFLPEGQRFFLNSPDYDGAGWYLDNLNFNLAFGYPF